MSLPTVTLPGTPITTTALGFGCSDLVGPKTRAESLALLETAYEAGVRHFDVARYYGFGNAEGLVGEFARSRRSELTITTKFGIKPLQNVAQMGGVIKIARRLMRLSGPLRKLLGRAGGGMTQRGAFGVDDARESLETSLRALQTDYVDIFLLHEGDSAGCASPGLREFLLEKQAAGVIRAFGVGTSFQNVEAVVREQPDFARVVQFENNALTRDRERLPVVPERAVITHRALSGSFSRLRDHLAFHPDMARQWSSETGANCADSAVLASLMLGYAIQANPGGIVLFSSTRPAAIRANGQIFDRPYSPDQVTRFSDLAAAWTKQNPAP